MNAISQMIVVGIAALAGLAALALARMQAAQPGAWKTKIPGKGSGWRRRTGKPAPVEQDPILIVEQLDPKTGKVVHRYLAAEIPDEGLSISRPNARAGDLKLDPVGQEAFTVSEKHACIGRDDAGIFIQDRDSTGGMRRVDGSAVEELDVTDGLILFLGRQPLRFRIPGAKEPLARRKPVEKTPEEDTRLRDLEAISEMAADTRIYMPESKL